MTDEADDRMGPSDRQRQGGQHLLGMGISHFDPYRKESALRNPDLSLDTRLLAV
jgi:hypothetical protein